MKTLTLIAAVAALVANAADTSKSETLAKFVDAKVLPFNRMAVSSSGFVDREVDALDVDCDDRWCSLKSKAEYDAYRLDLRSKMLAAIGTMPERTPLNARTVATLKRDGYTIEKVIFESMPGLLVTANLFIPDGSGRRPTVVMSCGHADAGKDCDIYLRACVVAVKRGFVALMFDPYYQGERKMTAQRGSTNQHTQMGLRGNLLDWSAPLLRIWDGMRAIDYVLSRPEVDPERLGYMGQSGGGTMTALMEAADDRIKAAAPSCYLTSLRALCQHMGPQDGEQNIFGQLSFGLNHTGYVLIPDIPIAVTCKFSDMFSYHGVRTLFRTVRTLERNIGIGERAFLNCAPGPHGWTEATENSSVMFLAKTFMPECRDLKIDLEELWLLDQGFDLKASELGLSEAERGCTLERSTAKAGSRHIYDIIAERFVAGKESRSKLDITAKRSTAARLAKVRMPAETGYRMKETFTGTVDNHKVSRIVIQYPKTGAMIPAVVIDGAAADKEPVVIVSYKGRAHGMRLATAYIENGHPVMIADVTGVGEIGQEMFIFYGAKDRPDEGLGAMCYLIGEPLVGRRATDMLILAEVMTKRCNGRKPLLVGAGPLAIPAAHAYAADVAAFSAVELAERPDSWFDVLSDGSNSKVELRYADLVPGAALAYDWTELIAR